MPTAAVCPQCGAPLLAGTRSCAYCRVQFNEPVAGGPIQTLTAVDQDLLPQVPAEWIPYANPWSGFALAHPPKWRVVCSQGVINVRQDNAGMCSATLQPVQLQAPTTAEEFGRQWMANMRANIPSFNAWQVPEKTPNTGRMTLRVQAQAMGIPLVGSYYLMVQGQNALISGFQCPSDQAAEFADTFQIILSSFRPIERMPRQMQRESSENAYTLWIPTGWQVKAGLNRSNPGGGAMFSIDVTRDTSYQVRASTPWITWQFQEGMPNMWMMQKPAQNLAYTPATQLCPTVVLKWMNQYHQNLEIEEVIDRPDILPYMAAEFARGGVNPQMLDLSAAILITTFTENNTPMRQVSRIMAQHPRASMSIYNPMGGGVAWSAFMDSYYRAPQAEFDALEPILAGILDAVVPNPDWQQKEMMRLRGLMMQQQQGMFPQQQQPMFPQQQQPGFDVSQMMNQAFEQRGAAQDRISQAWSNAMLGNQDVNDQSGNTFNVPSGFDQYWKDGLNTVYGGSWSSAPDPTWEKLDPSDT